MVWEWWRQAELLFFVHGLGVKDAQHWNNTTTTTVIISSALDPPKPVHTHKLVLSQIVVVRGVSYFNGSSMQSELEMQRTEEYQTNSEQNNWMFLIMHAYQAYSATKKAGPERAAIISHYRETCVGVIAFRMNKCPVRLHRVQFISQCSKKCNM